jgi:rhodanese-related sulfurtransferase
MAITDENAEAPPIVDVEASEVYRQMQAGEQVILLDVRMPWDHELQHPQGARSLPLPDLPARLAELNPERRYVLSCYHGHSSRSGVAFLQQHGFQNVENLAGGFSGWVEAGLPLETREW